MFTQYPRFRGRTREVGQIRLAGFHRPAFTLWSCSRSRPYKKEGQHEWAQVWNFVCYVEKSTSVKTIRPLSLPVPIPAQRARKPSQMQQKTNSSHLPPPAGPTGVHPDAVPLILFSLAYASRVPNKFFCAAVIRLFLPNFAAIRWDLSFFLDI